MRERETARILGQGGLVGRAVVTVLPGTGNIQFQRLEL